MLNIVEQINELRMTKQNDETLFEKEKTFITTESELDQQQQQQQATNKLDYQKAEKNASALIYVILEICVKDL